MSDTTDRTHGRVDHGRVDHGGVDHGGVDHWGQTETLRSSADSFQYALQKHSASPPSNSRTHHIFALIKPDFYFLVRTGKQTLPLAPLHNEFIAFDIDFMHLMGWLIHSLVPTALQRFIRCIYKSVRRKQKRFSTLSVSVDYGFRHPQPCFSASLVVHLEASELFNATTNQDSFPSFIEVEAKRDGISYLGLT